MRPSEKFMIVFVFCVYAVLVFAVSWSEPWLAFWMVLMVPFVFLFALFLEWLDR